MSAVWVTSDWHLGHRGINKFRPRYADWQTMGEELIATTNKLLSTKDTLYCLGDMAFNQDGLNMLRGLTRCRKILVAGNHDYLRALDYLSVFDDVVGAVQYKHGVWMTHIPIHPMELRGGWSVHGHCHAGGPRETQWGDHWKQYYNAILEYNDYMPVRMEHIVNVLEENLDD